MFASLICENFHLATFAFDLSVRWHLFQLVQLFIPFHTMADPAARAAWVHEHVDADLQFIFQEAGMSEQVQYDIGQHYKTVRRFSALADTRADLRTALAADFTLRADNAAGRAEVAAVVAAWESSRQSYEEEIKLRQEAKGLGLTRPLPHTDRSAMLRAVEQSKGEDMAEREQPSSEYIALLLEEIEQDEVTAHTLDEITSKKDSQTLQLQSSLDQSGRVRITRQKPKGKLPTTTEELRQKLRLEAHAWLMVAAKMKNKVYLRGLEQKHFDRYTDYVLGDKCYQLLVPGASGEKQPLHPPWHILLDYEFELRKKAIRKAHKEARPLHVTLREATEDTELKELHFTSPVTFAAMERPSKTPRWEQDPPKGHKGKGKGKKGKDQGKTSYLPGTKLELITHTPDGKQICYRYNMKGKKCDGKCNRVHICRVKGCQQNHPAYEHPVGGS